MAQNGKVLKEQCTLYALRRDDMYLQSSENKDGKLFGPLCTATLYKSPDAARDWWSWWQSCTTIDYGEPPTVIEVTLEVTL